MPNNTINTNEAEAEAEKNENPLLNFILLVKDITIVLFRSITALIINRIVLPIIFFGIFMPIGFTLRLFGNDPLFRKFESTKKSYYQTSKIRKKNHMDNPF